MVTVANAKPTDFDSAVARGGESNPGRTALPASALARRMVVCPHCGRMLRWTRHQSAVARCPTCRGRFIVRVLRDGTCLALLLTAAATDELICDWLVDPRDREEEDLP
ncbi:MAG: hypothetical protein ACYSUI_12700 [Planctomycetota bacterium]|jgi:DNA-directed RNA polymerase subunit RPC12/RpoP